MPFQLLDASDVSELNTAWRRRSDEVFSRRVVTKFIDEMLDFAMKNDLKAQLLGEIKNSIHKDDIWVSAGRCYEPDYEFTFPDTGEQKMSIEHLIHRTDALKMLAAELGPCIKVMPLHQEGVIFIAYYFVPGE